MRVLRSFLRFLAVVFGSLLFSAMCSGVDALAYSDGRFMTASEALQVFGSTISAKYYNGSGYTDFQFVYDSVISDTFSVNSSGSSWTYEGNTYLKYTANVDPNLNPQYITCDIQPSYSIFDTSQIHSVIALGGDTSNWVSTTYQSPSWDWYFNGNSYHLENNDESNSPGYHSYFSYYSHTFLYVCADFSSQNLTSGYSSRAVFSGLSGGYTLLIGLPYISADASGTQGTFTTSSGSDININIDMDETNQKLDEQTGLLQSIKQGIQGIFDTIKNALVSVFVPDDDFMDEFKTDMQDLLSEHLGGLYQAVSAIDDIFDQFGDARAKGSIHIDAVQVPLAGETLTLGNWDVPLKQDGLSLLYDGIAFIIDFLAVAAFLNMCRNKLEIFLNPDSEVIRD